MNRMRLATLSATAIGLALAGCAKKPPKTLPPPPPAQTEAPSTGAGYGNNGASQGAVPGSRADMIAQAGSDTVHFATESSDVDPEGQQTLTKQAVWLRKYPQVRVTIEGHCDERGTREYNLALGDRRATAAKNFLVSQGVSMDNISATGFGKNDPVASNDTAQGRAQNRRVNLVVSGNAIGVQQSAEPAGGQAAPATPNDSGTAAPQQ